MIACVNMPYFAAAVERRDDSTLAEKPLVVGGKPWEPRPVYAFSQEVAQRGVRPGMSLRLAHVLSPDSHFMGAAPAKYQATSSEVIDTLIDFTHLVEPENLWQPTGDTRQLPVGTRSLPARYHVDLEDLPQREAFPLVREIGKTVRSYTGLGPAIGLAADKFTAQVAATLTRPHHARSVPSGTERSFLADRSIEFLPLGKEPARRLRLLGIYTLGQLAELPPAALHTQFGPEIIALYRLARGEGPPHLQPRPAMEPEQVQHLFTAPVANLLTLQRVLERLASELAGRLQKTGMAARNLQLISETEVEAHHHTQILRQPTADPTRLSLVFQEILDQFALTAAVTAFTVTATDLVPATVHQLSLFAREHTTPEMERTLQNVLARHTTAAFYRPLLTDRRHPLPECRFQLRALRETAPRNGALSPIL